MASQIAIAQIPAPTGDEGERGDVVQRRFQELGLANVHADGAGNVVGRRLGRAESDPLVICAHLDTVFSRDTDLTVREERGRLIGPGINDNGRGLAVMLALAAEIDGKRLVTRRPIDFVATTGEEGNGDLRGAKHFFSGEGRSAAAAIALDGAGDDRVVHQALGSRRMRVSFDGPGGHSWAAFGSPNAVHAAAIAAAWIARVPLPAFPRTSLTIGRIGGGISVNAIAEHAWFEIDARSTSDDVLETLAIEIARAVRAAEDDENARRARGFAPLVATIERIGHRPCGETPTDHPLVAAAIEATALIGRVPEITLASTDANVPISLGIPAIAIGGGGRGGDAHTAHEWFENVDGPLGVARALTIVMAAAD